MYNLKGEYKLEQKDKKILLDKLHNKKALAGKMVTNTNFLTPMELSVCLEDLKFETNYIVTGGVDDAERQMIVFYPDYISNESDVELPIKALRVKHKNTFSHRDVLGSLMGLGIKREQIGDIQIFDKQSIILATENIFDFILKNLLKIGKECVTIDIIQLQSVTRADGNFDLIKDTVKSLRLDSVVASGYKTSRAKALEAISSQKVFINNLVCTKPDKKVNENDKISIKGKGKIILKSISGMSKKERIFIEIEKYN